MPANAAINSNAATNPPALKRVTVGEAVIEYRVQFSRRRKKTIQIAVRDGAVVVSAPARTPQRELREVVIRRADWILRHLAAAKPAAPEPPALATGDILPYCGQNLELVIELRPGGIRNVPQLAVISREGDKLLLKTLVGPAGTADPEFLRTTLIEWYQSQAEELVRAAVNQWWPALGRGDFPRILIRNQRRRWGSCAGDGTLRFNWRLAMLDPALTEYVAVHELAHLTHMNHSPQFWQLVTQHLPDTPERRKRLRAVEKELPTL